MPDGYGESGYNYGYDPDIHSSMPEARAYARRLAQKPRKSAAQLALEAGRKLARQKLRSLLMSGVPGVKATDFNLTAVGPRGVGLTGGVVVNHESGLPSDPHVYAGLAISKPNTGGATVMGSPSHVEAGQRYIEGSVVLPNHYSGAAGFRSSPKPGESGWGFEDPYVQGGVGAPQGAAVSWFYVF